MKFNDVVLDSIKDVYKKYPCYLVGGYIRDYILNGSVSYDRDILTNDSYKLALDIQKITEGTLVELDLENKIYRVVLKDKVNYFDITQCENIEDDAKRRDFTINSLLYDLNNGKLIDFTGGIKDIENKILRCYRLDNLKDDPLRMFRMYRFSSLTGFEVEKKLNDFVKNNFKLVLNCAMERINYEILHLFEGKYFADTLDKMYEDGNLEIIFPFVKEIKKIPPNSHHHLDLVHHSIETARKIRINKPILKLAAFYHDIGKPSTWKIEDTGRHRFIGHDIAGSKLVEAELEKLKFSRAQIKYVSKMVRYHIYPAALAACEDSKKAYARFVRKMGEDTVDIIELSRADRLSARGYDVSDEMVERALLHLEKLLKYYNEVKNQVKNPKSLLDGKEIMELLDIKPSKLVGEIIERLIEEQLAGSVKTKEEAVEFVKNDSRVWSSNH